ncbi:MAG: radical SAM protein [Candidatus Aminicenantes bacterium]|nr:radical SAM protein [Candidatus Aminicenantes bacterium]
MKSLKYWRRLTRLFYHFRKKSSQLPYLPVRLWIELTSYCNLKCIMCPNQKLTKKDKGYLDFDLYRKIIDEAASFAFEVNLAHRGESLLYPDLIEAIRYAKEHGLFTRLHTNGSLLTSELASSIIDSGLDRLSFSFDGYNKENYEKIRIKGNFDRTIANIIQLLEMKKSLHLKRPRVAIEVIDFTPEETRKKARAKDEFRNRFQGLPLDEMVVKELHNWAGETSAEKPSSVRTICTFPWNALIIFWDGSVLPCSQDFFGSYILGNVKHSSLRDIWNNERMVSLRQKLASKEVADLNPCASCDRLRRKNILGVPKEYLWKFLSKRMP